MKKGFGLMEVMIAAVVLGFLVIGLNRLQAGNREAVLRVRTRDAAQIVAQNFIDGLSRQGVSSVGMTGNDGKDTIVSYKWEGNNGKIVDERPYTINYKINVVEDLNSTERSNFTKNDKADTTFSPAKKVDLKVKWTFKSKKDTLSINVSRVIK